MKRLFGMFWRLLIGVSLFMLAACSGNGGGTKVTSSDTIIPGTTKVLSKAAMDQMTAVSPDGMTLTFPTSAPGISSLKVGDVIVSDVTTAAPRGMLRKVTSITTGSNGIDITTTSTTLEQSIQKASISVSRDLSSSNLLAANALRRGVSFRSAARTIPPVLQIDNVVLYDADDNASTTADQVVANGSVTLNPSFNFEVDIDNFAIKSATFTNTMVESANITVSSNAQHTLAKEVELATYEFAPITYWAGSFPVVITPVLHVVVGATGQISVGLTSSVTQEATLTAGLRYENGSWAPVSQKTNTFTYDAPAVTANASAKAYAGPQLDLMLYGVVGPYANIHGYLELDADAATTPWWTLYGGLQADVGMKMTVLGRTVADHSALVIDYREVLKQAQQVSTTTGSLVAAVQDAVTRTGLPGVTVTVSSQGTVLATGTTDSSGAVSLSVPEGSSYAISFTKAGYLAVNYGNVAVTGSISNYLAAVLQIDSNHAGPGNVSGTIVNALTGETVSGLSIAVRSGINVTDGATVATGSTSSNGSYSFTGLAAGNYTAEISGAGFTTAHFTITSIGGVTTANQNYSLTPILPAGQTRIVLTWGATPSDLDSHLTGPQESGGRFHTYYSDKTFYYGSSLYAGLDLDDTSSYGPETTTIYHQSTGVYRFSVHDYSNRYASNNTAMANSGAKVTVYRGSNVVAIYNVPNGVGTLWTVFELDGDTITPVNTMTNHVDPDTVLRPVSSRGTDAALLRNLPKK